jgi:ABC-type antimicrobial peptide transport system permease subunit
MNKLSAKSLPNSSDSSFKTLADVTEKLSHGRSDGVAIVAIFGLVVVSMTLILSGVWIVYAANQNSRPEIKPNSVHSQQSYK